MKYFELDKNEKKLLNDFEQGKLKKVSGAKKKIGICKEYTRQTLNKIRDGGWDVFTRVKSGFGWALFLFGGEFML